MVKKKVERLIRKTAKQENITITTDKLKQTITKSKELETPGEGECKDTG